MPNEGVGDTFARILADAATNAGFTSKRENVEMVIDYVQKLPYVPDDVSTEYDDYTKFIAETLVQGGGDGEDTAILLATLLQSEPFGYDCILIQPPNHMAVGVYGDDLPGYYWELDAHEYYYVETTGSGWDIENLLSDYQDAKARAIQV